MAEYEAALITERTQAGPPAPAPAAAPAAANPR